MNYFKPEEFDCKCGCGKNNISPDLVDRLNVARYFAGISFTITSGCRCDEHNAKVSTVENGPHPNGTAADISATTSRNRFLIQEALFKAGFRRIGTGKNFVHADIDSDKVSELSWNY